MISEKKQTKGWQWGSGEGGGTGDVVLVRVKCNISNGPITYYPAVVCSCFCLFNLRCLNTVSPGWSAILHSTIRLPKITLVLRAMRLLLH